MMIRRSLVRVTSLVMLVAALSCGVVTWYYWEGVKIMWQEQQVKFHHAQERVATARYGVALPEVDEVRLLRLDEKEPTPSQGTHEVAHTVRTHYIVAEKTVMGKEAEEIAAQWRQLCWEGGGGAACFEPHHVIEFRHRGKVICESAVCFLCGNLTLPAFPEAALVGFGAWEGPEKQAEVRLQSLLEGYVGKFIEDSKRGPAKRR